MTVPENVILGSPTGCCQVMPTAVNLDLFLLEWNAFLDLPADLSIARIQRLSLLLLKTGTVAGANFSLLMSSWVSGAEHTSGILNWPLVSVWARISLGWSETARLAPDTGTPVTLRTSPCSVRPSHTQWLQSSLGRPSGQTMRHLTTTHRGLFIPR